MPAKQHISDGKSDAPRQGKTTHLFGGVSELEKGTTLLGGSAGYLFKLFLRFLNSVVKQN
jgi:hypothetical protein